MIFFLLYFRVGQELTKNPNNDERSRNHYKETRKVLKMLIVVVVVFAILVLPLHVVQLWFDFFGGGKCSLTTYLTILFKIVKHESY